MSADLCFTTDCFSFVFLLFSPPNLRARWTELNPNRPHGRSEVKLCDLKTHVQNRGYPLPYKAGAKNLFGRLRNLTITLTAHIFGTKLGIDNRLSPLTTTRVLLQATSSQNGINFGPQTALNWIAIFTHPMQSLLSIRHCQASQTELSKQN